jgi:hypothetical protein
MSGEGSGTRVAVVTPEKEKLPLVAAVIVSFPNENSGPTRWTVGSNDRSLSKLNVRLPPPTSEAVTVELSVAVPAPPGTRDPENENAPVNWGRVDSLMDAE